MNYFKSLFLLIVLSLSLIGCRVQLEPIQVLTFQQKIEKLFPNAKITQMEVTAHFTKAFQMVLNEPLDHNNPAAGNFEHYVYVSHSDETKPTVLVTEGYEANPMTHELTRIFKGNQVQVEYRFYGKSRQDSIQWQYLTNDQAVEDYHQLVTKLKRLYTGKWISTGIGKGGETVLIYKSKYPWDVEVAVPYGAPLFITQEDPRAVAHLKTVGSDTCRVKITEFQREVLTNREAILKEINSYAEVNEMSFKEISIEEVLEYAVLDFPFSFWQSGGTCEAIPGKNASAKDQFDYMNSIVSFRLFNDKTYYDLLPFYYQHMKELGYYGFNTAPVRELLSVVRKPTYMRFAPKNVDLTYNPNYIKGVRDYIENQGNRILYIYGEYDPWIACAPIVKPHVDSFKIVLEGGSQKTGIKQFTMEDKQLIYNKLQNWLGYSVTIYPLTE